MARNRKSTNAPAVETVNVNAVSDPTDVLVTEYLTKQQDRNEILWRIGMHAAITESVDWAAVFAGRLARVAAGRFQGDRDLVSEAGVKLLRNAYRRWGAALPLATLARISAWHAADWAGALKGATAKQVKVAWSKLPDVAKPYSYGPGGAKVHAWRLGIGKEPVEATAIETVETDNGDVTLTLTVSAATVALLRKVAARMKLTEREAAETLLTATIADHAPKPRKSTKRDADAAPSLSA